MGSNPTGPTMKTIWIVISGESYDDAKEIEGCFVSLKDAEEKLSVLKAKSPGDWDEVYSSKWKNGYSYLKLEEHQLVE